MTVTFGAFGKMPGLGDFFRSGLPRDLVEPWDAWLQETMISVRASLGDAWQNAYMSAPIWRFTIGPDTVGPHAVLGVLMPSIDRVGRQFPLTLGAIIPQSESAILDHYAAETAFTELERIALDALDDNMTRDTLAEQLNEVTFSAPPQQCKLHMTPTTIVATDAGRFGPIPELAAEMLSAKLENPSIWSANVPGGMRIMACKELPDSYQARGLFDLNAPVWTKGGQV